jgi:hypothetical protein
LGYTQIEATAIEAALMLLNNNTEVNVITDSLVTITNIQNWEKWGVRKKAKSSNGSMIHRILKLIKEKELTVKWWHVYSHLLDTTKYNDKDKKQKMEEMTKRFGDFTNNALIGNAEVDSLTKSESTTAHFPSNPDTYQRFVLKMNGEIVEGNYYKILLKALHEQDIAIWSTQGTTLNMVFDDNSNRALSTWPLETHLKYTDKKMITFKLKLYSGLPTKHVMVNRLPQMIKKYTGKKSTHWILKNKMKFKDHWCPQCEEETIEDTDHVFDCPSRTYMWDELADKLLQKFHKYTGTKYTTLPFWFKTSKHVEWIGSKPAARALKNFDKKWGNRGVIPKDMSAFIKEELTALAVEDSDQMCEKITRSWTHTMAKGVMYIWFKRNEDFEKWFKATWLLVHKKPNPEEETEDD